MTWEQALNRALKRGGKVRCVHPSGVILEKVDARYKVFDAKTAYRGLGRADLKVAVGHFNANDSKWYVA